MLIKYKIFGYKGKQVDNIHSKDLVQMIFEYLKKPKIGEVYNVGGEENQIMGMTTNVKRSVKNLIMVEENRVGDHKWWITNCNKFKKDYPNWKQKYNIDEIISEIYFSYKK